MEDFSFQILHKRGELFNLTCVSALQMAGVIPMAFRNDFKTMIIMKEIFDLCIIFERGG